MENKKILKEKNKKKYKDKKKKTFDKIVTKMRFLKNQSKNLLFN